MTLPDTEKERNGNMNNSRLDRCYVSDVEVVKTAMKMLASMPGSQLFSAELTGKRRRCDPRSKRPDPHCNARTELQEKLSAILNSGSDSFAEICSKVEAMQNDVAMGFGFFGEEENLRTCLIILSELVIGFMVNTFTEE